MTTGEKIKEARLENEMTQVELAELSGVSPFSISQIENNIRRNIRKDTLKEIAKALDRTVESLNGDKEVELVDVLEGIERQLKRIARAMESRR